MLAVQSAMDALRGSGSHGSDRHILLREPSAEDLDAAHQLVSSARGERKNPPVSLSESNTSTSRNLSIRQLTNDTSEEPGPEPHRAISESREKAVSSNFSHIICR